MPQPLQRWLEKSYLTQLNDKSCILFVDKETKLLLKDIGYLSKIYPLAQKIYPDITSLYISENQFISLLKENKIQPYTVINK